MFYRQIEHKLPTKWKDPKLAIGYLSLGELNQDVDTDAIANNKYVPVGVVDECRLDIQRQKD